ncbi:Bifunctional F420 biosynthesis protein FbiB [Methanimicrococcus stummii]|uniref:Bifunctional F420 biosynthesis protein FbiB n=1 Tax=Methanimicrococcus stummii TaxID=3028294 RepID=A0AA96VAN7_9EURY|nr:coenzyme F420-0:L-glutamate ligase [Methanimicrococcus sp. Es2]WNY28810.1 Bifunctional F420 biosynthesis protein FbiB [Methanimicrococcus sp. Es2]
MSHSQNSNRPLEIFGLKSDLIHPGDDIFSKIKVAFSRADVFPKDSDIFVIAESALATAENRVAHLSTIQPSAKALEFEKLYQIDAREAELVIRESDVIFGGVFGVLLTLKNGLLCPNAGIDNSNAPNDCVILYPENPTKSAREIAKFILDEFGVSVGVIVADSRTQPLRLGCTGVAIGAAGFLATVDKRGETDLFGRPLSVTRVAVADNLASAAEAVMGESNESTPFALIRNANAVFDSEAFGITTISPEECMYWGVLSKSEKEP